MFRFCKTGVSRLGIRKLVKVVTVMTGIMTIFHLAFNFLLSKYIEYKLSVDINEASSIGIIGGADGPTAIFLASPSYINLTAIFPVITIAGIVYLILNRKEVR